MIMSVRIWLGVSKNMNENVSPSEIIKYESEWVDTEDIYCASDCK